MLQHQERASSALDSKRLTCKKIEKFTWSLGTVEGILCFHFFSIFVTPRPFWPRARGTVIGCVRPSVHVVIVRIEIVSLLFFIGQAHARVWIEICRLAAFFFIGRANARVWIEICCLAAFFHWASVRASLEWNLPSRCFFSLGERRCESGNLTSRCFLSLGEGTRESGLKSAVSLLFFIGRAYVRVWIEISRLAVFYGSLLFAY